jgi:hypothetical protein
MYTQSVGTLGGGEMKSVALVPSVIRRLPNSLCPTEESILGHMGVKGIFKLGKRNTKGSIEPTWKPEAKRVLLLFRGF